MKKGLLLSTLLVFASAIGVQSVSASEKAVESSVSALAATEKTLTLKVNQEKYLPNEAGYSYTNSDNTVFGVFGDGKVRGIGKGTAKCKIYDRYGTHIYTYTITVN